jgi:hypothetical protein
MAWIARPEGEIKNEVSGDGVAMRTVVCTRREGHWNGLISVSKFEGMLQNLRGELFRAEQSVESS